VLEEYGVPRKWVIIMDKRQDKNAASTPAAEKHLYVRLRIVTTPEGGAKKRRGNREE